MAKDNGLLIAALVAIVAVVGLVILFKGGSTGAVTCGIHEELAMITTSNSQGSWECRPIRPDILYMASQTELEKGMMDEYGKTWDTYQRSRARRDALAAQHGSWEPQAFKDNTVKQSTTISN